MDTKKIIAGAISGFMAAFIVDIHAWEKSDKFAWGLAAKRWFAGAVTGAMGALGVAQFQ